jgi:hypothetical protein
MPARLNTKSLEVATLRCRKLLLIFFVKYQREHCILGQLLAEKNVRLRAKLDEAVATAVSRDDALRTQTAELSASRSCTRNLAPPSHTSIQSHPIHLIYSVPSHPIHPIFPMH